MAAKLLGEFKQRIASLEMVPSGGGCFEVDVDGERIYSKLETSEFPDEGAIIDQIDSML